ncbi:MAG: formylglycine-generating enzyme family protein [Saprospiraceae bacterium]|jgi:formylglycine-generating enzyme required for sulfatase activity
MIRLAALVVLTANYALAQKVTHIQIPGSDISFEMVSIPSGKISGAEIPEFWMGVREVTWDEFALFQEKQLDTEISTHPTLPYKLDAISRPTPQYIDFSYGMGKEGGFPAVSMTRRAALAYCQWLYKKTGVFFRLPTEAEWQYVCSEGSGQKLPPSYSEVSPDEFAWFDESSDEKYHTTGTKKPNQWGVYDLIGNVSEWTMDGYSEDYYLELESKGEKGILWPLKKHPTSVMGSNYQSSKTDCNCQTKIASTAQWQKRDPQIPKSKWWNTDAPFVGFRLVRPIVQPDAQSVATFFEKALKN